MGTVNGANFTDGLDGLAASVTLLIVVFFSTVAIKLNRDMALSGPDFSGGFVQVMTKNIPDGNTFNVSYQMGFNTNATFRSFQLTDGSWKDYLGFGAGVRSLPSSFPSHLGDYSTEEAAAFTRRINQRWGINRFTAIPDQKISLTSHRSFDAGDWKIGNIANVNW